MARNVICPYDDTVAELVDSAVIYGRSYGMAWLCRKCGAYVGTHKNSRDHAPLGRLANAELRTWKQRAHAAFDPLWRSGLLTRREAYAWASQALSIPPEETHIGMFDVEQCKRLIAAINELRSNT